MKHYNFSFYSHRANPGLTDTNFCQTHNNENGTFTYDYADIFTGPGNSGDLHVHTSHPFLMDANINWVFTQFYFIPAFNALIVKLQRLELSRKSGFVLNEIERRAHEFVLNHSLRYRSDSPRDHDLVTAERLYNKNSAFLDLHHSLPFQRDLFYFNSIRTFARRFRSGNSCLLRNEKRSDFPTGAGIEIEKKANPQNKLNPLSLADQCALQLRKHVAAEFCKAFPCEADFQHSRFTKTIQNGCELPCPPRICKFLETLVYHPDQEFGRAGLYRDYNAVESIELQDRKELLESQVRHTLLYEAKAPVRVTEYRKLGTLCVFLRSRRIPVKVTSVHWHESLTDHSMLDPPTFFVTINRFQDAVHDDGDGNGGGDGDGDSDEVMSLLSQNIYAEEASPYSSMSDMDET